MDPTKIPIRASTQEHLEIEDIRDDLVILKDGGCVLVLTTTAINFGLLSEREQDATIYAYAAMINSLTFSLQIVLRSQKKDISSYLKLLDRAENKETKSEIKDQIKKYKKFIKEIVAKNEVLDKKFYLAIPMSALELGAKQALGSMVKKPKKLPFPKEYILEKSKASLYPKRDHLIKQLARLGLKSRQLTTPELIQLLFQTYNPEAGQQPVSQAVDLRTPIVQPAIESKPKPDQSKVEKEANSQNQVGQGLENEIDQMVKRSI